MLPLIVTAAIIRSPRGVLLTRRPGGSRHEGMWEFPGGKLDPGESPPECLRRELLEELDLPVEVGAIFEVVYHRYDWGPVLILAYECQPLSDRIRNLEVAEHRWVPPEELSSYEILAADGPIVDKLTHARTS